MAVNQNESGIADAEARRIARLYREAATEEPPSRLDALVCGAARRPLEREGPAKGASWWQMWRVPFALACVALLSVSVVTLIQREGGDPLILEPPASPPTAAESTGPHAATPAEAPPQSQTQPQSQSMKPAPGTAGNEHTARLAEPAPSVAEPAGGRPAAGPKLRELSRAERAERDTAERESRPLNLEEPAARDAAADVAVRERQAEAALSSQRPAAPERQPAPPAPPAAAPAPRAFAPPDRTPAAAPANAAKRRDQAEARSAVPSAIAAMVAELDGRPPERWIERVLELRRENRREDADALLAEFRRRYPDEPLPPSLR